MNGVNGVLLIDKPSGLTSHDVVARVRRDLKTRSVGHAGTLDPLATGVLVVLVGEATKLAPYLSADDKVYSTTIRLGIETDSLDSDGTITKTEDVPAATLAALAEGPSSTLIATALQEEIARTSQVPPAISAIHVNGARAYELARKASKQGVSAIDMEPRAVVVKELRVESVSALPPAIDLYVSVGKGYYVRALARDFAARLGTLGHVSRLRRIASGAFRIDDATPLAKDAYCMLSVEDVAKRTMPTATLTEDGVTIARHGKPLTRDIFSIAPATQSPTAMFDPHGRLVAIGALEGDSGKIVRGFSS